MPNKSLLTTLLRRELALLAALGLASGLCTAMVLARVALTGSGLHIFMLWNLFLAWIPLLAALAARSANQHLRLGWVPALTLGGMWLIFFPNAPYVVTDLLHLQAADGVPLWYDVIMLAAFAWTSFLLGFASLYVMQRLMSRAVNALAGWLFAIAVLSLSAFGIYLGRFLGWNSWDVFLRPLSLLADIWDQLRHPLAHPRTLVFSGLLSVFLISTYLVLVAFAQLSQETHGTASD